MTDERDRWSAFLSTPLDAVAADVMGETWIGRRFGSYEIRARLGAGGMGEVYRARDTRLGRDVAIKVLPASFVTDEERAARFEREARILAALNHPHIATIYGVEDIGGQSVLVLELVEGGSLADRIARGPLGWHVAGPIAYQIAEALEAAHEKGIVHRDLKPSNIALTKDGVVKVLDFGLAKGGDATAADASQSPTLTAAGTRDGVLLGTAAYMSPEQARGQPVDKRADIWAFGCVLYEMLAGRTAFAGETVSDHIAAVLEREPDWRALPADVPGTMHRLLRRCLQKDVKRRLHDIADARIEIQDALGAPTDAFATPAPRHRRWNGILWGAAAVVMVALAGSTAWTLARSRHTPVSQTVTRLTLQPSDTSRWASGMGGYDISPDGSQIAYIGAQGGTTLLFLRRLDQFEDAPVPGTDGATSPFFSADGQWVGFFANGKLQKVNAKISSTPMTLCNGIDTAGNNAGVWLSEDTIVFTSRDHGLTQVSAEGGEPHLVAPLSQKPHEVDHHTPNALPGGRALLFAIHQEEDRFSIAVLSLRSGERKVIVESGFEPHYLTSGHLVFARGDAILAVPFDIDRLEVVGAPVTLVEHVATSARDGVGNFVLSRSGTLVYRPERSIAGRALAWVDRSGKETPLPIATREFSAFRLSPDGRTVAFAAADGYRSDIWTYDIAADRLTRVTNEGDNTSPMWTPDGRWLTYASNRDGTHHLIRQTTDGAGVGESLLTSRNILLPGAWTDGDRTLLYVDWPPTDKFQMLALNLDRARHSESLGPRGSPNVSPDGRWLAYVSLSDAGQSEVYVEPLSAAGPRHQITVDGGRKPRWSRDGRELFYRRAGAVFRVAIDATHGFSAGKPVRLFENYVDDMLLTDDYDVAPDGRLLMIRRGDAERAPRRLNVVVNWVEELTRRVPVSASFRK